MSELPENGLDHIHNSYMVAFRALGSGKGLEDRISIPPLGQTSTIGKALSLASQHLVEPFHVDDLQTVDAAFKSIGLKRSNENKRESASRILAALLKARKAS